NTHTKHSTPTSTPGCHTSHQTASSPVTTTTPPSQKSSPPSPHGSAETHESSPTPPSGAHRQSTPADFDRREPPDPPKVHFDPLTKSRRKRHFSTPSGYHWYPNRQGPNHDRHTHPSTHRRRLP